MLKKINVMVSAAGVVVLALPIAAHAGALGWVTSILAIKNFPH